MAHKKKKPDCIMAGMLAILTAFSPVVSVIPTYAASDNEMSTSVTIDNDTDSGDGSGGFDGSGISGVVIDDSVQDPGTGQTDISITDDAGDGVVSEVIGDSSSEIQIEDTDDGISIENGQDTENIFIDPSTLSGNDIQLENTGDGVSVDQMMDGVSERYVLRFSFIGENGLVKITPNSDLAKYDTRYIRVHQNADGDRIASIYDENKQFLFESEVSSYVFCYQDDLPEGDSYTVEAIADYGYSVGTYSILMDSGSDDAQEPTADQTTFVSDHYQKYTWDVVMDSDKIMDISFSDDNTDLEYENTFGLADAKTMIENNQNTVSGDSISDDETEGQGSIILSEDLDETGFEMISSMADEVELPEITKKDEREAVADPIYEGYIHDNLNLDIVGEDDGLVPVSVMRVKQSLFDKVALDNRTDIDELMDDPNYPEYFVMQFETMVPIYSINADTDYLVAYVNTMQNDTRASVMDWDFAEYNYDGELLDGCIYDKDTGIAYIPKENAMVDGAYALDKIQVQLAQSINFNPSYTESVAVAGIGTEPTMADSCSMFTDYPTFDIGANLDESKLEVFMNGMPIDDEYYAYDASTGILTVNHSPALISSIYVKGQEPKSLFSSFLSNLFGLKTVKALGSWAEMKCLGEATVDSSLSDLKPGTTMRGKALYAYGERAKMSTTGRYPITNDESHYYCYMSNAVLTNDGAGAALASWIMGAGGKNDHGLTPQGVRILANDLSYIDFHIDPTSITSEDGFFDFRDLDTVDNHLIPMRCSHVGVGLGASNWFFFDGYGAVTTGNVALRVVEKYTKGGDTYIVVALMTGTFGFGGAPQTGLGLFNIKVTTKGVELRVNKNSGSALKGACSNNPRYDFKGAKFGVYKTKKAAENANVIDSTDDDSRDNKRNNSNLLGVLASKNANGLTGILSLDFCYKNDGKLKDDYKDGLFIRELESPYGFDLDPDVYPVDLPKNANNTDDKLITVTIKDPPLYDPGAMSMVKVPEGSINGEMTTAQYLAALRANPESMNGAEFELRYYKCWNNPDKYPLRKNNADMTWKLKTTTIDGRHGVLDMNHEECYIGGSPPPAIVNGTARMPLGMYVLEETKAPPGLRIKRNKMTVVANCFRASSTIGGYKHFRGSFRWLPDKDKYTQNNPDRVTQFNFALRDNLFGAAFVYHEPVDLYNVGVYKSDKNKDLFEVGDKTGNLTFDGIEFGLIWGEENEGPFPNALTEETVEPGSQIPGITLKFSDGKNYATTEHLNNGKGVVGPGTYYFIETKGNGTYLKSEERLKIVIPNGAAPGKTYFPGKDGKAIPQEEAFDNTGKPTDAIEPFENVSPPMGVELDKTTWTNFGEMKTDDYILGDMTYKDYIFGKQDIGDATLEGHTFAIFHTSDNDIELKDGTKVKSAKNKLEDPENPTWQELNNLYELTDGKIQENGYICDIIVTDEKGEAKTDPDAFSIGTYWVIEVATKEDYVVNNVDVGRVGGDDGVKADDLTPDGGLIKAVFKHNGETADDGACWNPPVSGGAHIQKLDEMRDDDREHGDTDLAATFKIVNASKKAVKNKYGETIPTSGLTDEPDFPTYDQVRAASETCTVYEITADKNGVADTEEHDLIYGTYYVIETAVPDGYYLNTEWVGKIVIREDGKIVPVCKSNNDLHDEYNHYYYDRTQKEPVVHPDDAVACRDQIYRGGVAVQKIDKEMGWQTAQGMGTLKGAEFTILNASESSVRNIDGKDIKSVIKRKDFQETYQQLWRIANETDSPYVMQRIYTNKEGFACTDKFDLPYGTYYIIETKAPLGYWLDEEFVGKIVIRDDGRCMMISDSDLPTENGSNFYDINDKTSAHKNTVDDQVRRCDLYFRKVDIDGNPKANIPFLISAIRRDGGGQETILESHVIVSDENGVVTTSSEDITVQIGSSRVTYPGRAHSNNTNGMDKFVQNKIVNPLGEAHLKNGDAARWGIWFQGNGTDYPKDSVDERYVRTAGYRGSPRSRFF